MPDDTPLPFGHRKIMPDQGNDSSDHAAKMFSREDRAVRGGGSRMPGWWSPA